MDAIDAFDRFDCGLDGDTRGRSAEFEFDSGAELDRLLDAAATMRALDAADWSADPDPAFLHRLKERLDMNTHAATALAQAQVIGPSRRLTWGARAPQTKKRNGGFAVLELVAASLLIFMFAGVAYNAGAFNRFMPSVATPIPAVTTNVTGMYRGDAGRTGVLTGPGPTGAPILAWKKPAFAAYGNPPVVAGDRVYFIEQDPTSRRSFVTCIDVKTGEKIWSSQVDADSRSAPAVGANLVFVTTGNALFALNADTGARVWRYDGDGAIDPGAPAFANGIVYFTTRNLWLRAVNAATGKEAWRTVLPYAAVGDAKTVDSGDRAFAAPSVSGGIVIAMGGNSFVMAADATTGKELWRRQVGDGAYPPKTLVMSDGAVYLGAAVSDPPRTGTPAPGETIYVRGILLALDARTGAVRWSQEGVPPPNGLAIDNGVLLVAQGAVINAMDASTGKELWWFGVSGGSYEPTVAGGVVYVRAWNGRLYGLNEKTGDRMWEAFVGASGDPVVANGTVMVIGARSIYAIGGDASATAPYNGDPKLSTSR